MNIFYNKPDSYNINSEPFLKNELFGNGFYKNIICSESFQRLKKISFLGAIDYTTSKQYKSSRYEHSIGVAELALYVCKIRNYSKEIQDHVVVAALLHDIGHAPLSHSMESSFKDEFGIDHHIAGTNLLMGAKSKTSSLNKILNKVDLSLVVDLIEQKSNEPFSDIFNSPINVDTIDGIYRSLKYINKNKGINKRKITKASFGTMQENDESILDEFWKNKNLVYKLLITNGICSVADHISREYFEDNKNRLDESFFYKKESSLTKGRKPIFRDFTYILQNIKLVLHSRLEHAQNIKKCVFDVTKREYKINSNQVISDSHKSSDIFKRFSCRKYKEKQYVSYIINERSAVDEIQEQLKLELNY
ncbi:MAG: HD domain-containing protein [Desulfobacteraceae bacterium]|nr:HD domain-containing protein [Desulfobacteraceae bacterium]